VAQPPVVVHARLAGGTLVVADQPPLPRVAPKEGRGRRRALEHHVPQRRVVQQKRPLQAARPGADDDDVVGLGVDRSGRIHLLADRTARQGGQRQQQAEEEADRERHPN